MKKLFSFVVVAALATSFASCGGGGDKAATEAPAADTNAVETPAVVEAPAVETATTPAVETGSTTPH